MTESARIYARQLAQEALQRNDPTGWFEQFYAGANGNEQAIAWADMAPNINLVDWLEQQHIQGHGRKALVVGCGLGDDAEELARRGFEVTAFDISATAIAWCQRRFPTSPVNYVAADVLQPPTNWYGIFDFVLEIYTLQVLPSDIRRQALQQISNMVAPEGTLLLICRGREAADDPGKMPWPLTRAECEQVQNFDLTPVHFEDFLDREEPPTRRFRIEYKKKLLFKK